MNGYISVREAAGRWDITERQVQKLCGLGKIPGVIHFGKSWAIPEDAVKPTRTGKLKPGPRKKTDNGQEAGSDGKSE
jgi:hypothetical protein